MMMEYLTVMRVIFLAHRLGGIWKINHLTSFRKMLVSIAGAYAQFESHIYDCMLNGTTIGNFHWVFNYSNNTVTKTRERILFGFI